MPKQTFFNLPDQKRQTIVNAAIEEFAEWGFEAASINRIVANSGIAKGSFYQYFADKMDVFKHLITLLAQEKTAFFQDKHPPGDHLDTFQYYRWMVKVGMDFNSTNPRLIQAISRVLFGEGLIYSAHFNEQREQSSQMMAAMLQQAMDRGEVDPSVDVELAVMVMETWNNAITNYFLKEGLRQPDIMAWVRSPQTQERIDKMLYVMEYGLRRTESAFQAERSGGEIDG
jgi:AcrR family transcriptional regulator